MVTLDQVIAFMSAYAYQPAIVYSFILLMLVASSFGLPIPEEITLISAGVLGHIGLHPDLYPNPAGTNAEPVNAWSLAIVCFLAVFLSDTLVYAIGRLSGNKIRTSPRFKKIVNAPSFLKVEKLTEEYGALMSGVFRFTPGFRFPGHLVCGMMRIPVWKFTLIDGMAALLTVPTQVLLVSYYGKEIAGVFKQFKIALIIIFALIILYYVVKKSTRVRGWLGLDKKAN